ncbi:MAG: DUF3710 domain-containing protein [Gemmatimonadota bacterium]
MAVFRRRRREGEDQPGTEADEPGTGAAETEEDGDREEAGEPGGRPLSGPWDIRDDVPPADRVDLGSLQVPVGGDYDVQVSMAEDQAAWVSVIKDESGLQLQAFAAPKSGGLWDEVREEIAAEVRRSGGQATEAVGRFGPELHARIAAADQPGAPRRGALEPVRFLGVDGPRWFLRGVISGAAASRPELAIPLEEVFAGVVVVRGEHPVPPRDLLEIRLPEEARQALAEQMEQAGGRFQLPDPFERGPEITETR